MLRVVVISAVVALMQVSSGGGAAQTPAKETATLQGKLVLGVDGVDLTDLGPVVVYLESTDPTVDDHDVPDEVPKIRQKNAMFEPRFLMITAGQTVEMPNEDSISHNVFSYSKPNDFDLGLYRKGESKTIAFTHPGLVKMYCSIHESMNAIIFVAPTRHHCRVTRAGTFRIRDVPSGKYRLKLWNEKLPEVVREVVVSGASTPPVTLHVGG